LNTIDPVEETQLSNPRSTTAPTWKPVVLEEVSVKPPDDAANFEKFTPALIPNIY